jgi:hypothetical protein
MEPLPRETSGVRPERPAALQQSASVPMAPYVAIIFKERRYDTGAHKIWFFANIHHVAIVNGRVQLTRQGFGLVLDVPYAEVQEVYVVERAGEQVYVIEEGDSLQVA